MFILPNGVKITEETCDVLCEVMVEDGNKCVNFLDVETGDVFEISKAHKRKLACFERDGERYIIVTRVKMEERVRNMKEFINSGIANLDAGTRGKILRMLDQSPDLVIIEKILDKENELEAWLEWENYSLFELLKEWLYSPPINAKDDEKYWFGDDDCPLCKAMREGKL